MMDSIWETDVQMPDFPQLEGELHTDVLIVGGGLAGLLCAWNLTREGVDCALIEENQIMSGVSGRTTAKLTSMSSSMAAAMVLTDLVQDRENPYAALFSPSRSILHKQLLCNGVESAVNLLRLTKPRCPHLGCALRWNGVEHSWDCPYHGSRFDADGRVLNNPATDDMKHPPRL